MNETRRLSNDVHQIENRVLKAASVASLRKRKNAENTTNNLLTGLTDWHGDLVNRITGEKVESNNNVIPIEFRNDNRLKSNVVLSESSVDNDTKNKTKKKRKKSNGFWS